MPKQALVFTYLQYKSFEHTVGKGEIARNEQFLLFPQCFQPIWRTIFDFHQIWNCCLQSLSVWKSLKSVVLERVKQNCEVNSWKKLSTKALGYPYHFVPHNSLGIRLLKILWEKEKMLVNSIFHDVYNLFNDILVKLELQSINAFNLYDKELKNYICLKWKHLDEMMM